MRPGLSHLCSIARQSFGLAGIAGEKAKGRDTRSQLVCLVWEVGIVGDGMSQHATVSFDQSFDRVPAQQSPSSSTHLLIIVCSKKRILPNSSAACLLQLVIGSFGRLEHRASRGGFSRLSLICFCRLPMPQLMCAATFSHGGLPCAVWKGDLGSSWRRLSLASPLAAASMGEERLCSSIDSFGMGSGRRSCTDGCADFSGTSLCWGATPGASAFCGGD